MTNEENYLEYLRKNEKEYKAYLIAKEHLGTLFRLENTVGFMQWKASCA